MATQVSKASSLEKSGHWLQALQCLRNDIRSGSASDAEIWHSIGRLHQRLANLSRRQAALMQRRF